MAMTGITSSANISTIPSSVSESMADPPPEVTFEATFKAGMSVHPRPAPIPSPAPCRRAHVEVGKNEIGERSFDVFVFVGALLPAGRGQQITELGKRRRALRVIAAKGDAQRVVEALGMGAVLPA